MEHEEHLKLLVKVAAGDRQAFAKLYQETSAQLYAVSVKILVRKELAEDAVQEAFIRIWHNAGNYSQGRGTVLTWMISIVRYRALDMLRYHKVRKEDGLENVTHKTDVDISDMQVADKKQLDHCLEQLDNKQKQVIHLAYFCGLTHQEVTTHVDSPLGSTKSLIRRGIQLLKRCLGL
ncbi:sigma-70 family RNA polymerase sigma factor [Paraglaciecola sp. 2405UD69-4]|uniref:sigma-70 family RNA polymerase sigma factor n=1 Tax=Paraglaciecola sp. 2405UD69-4 TaxID=3391836 RepID=UPI0039C9013F